MEMDRVQSDFATEWKGGGLHWGCIEAQIQPVHKGSCSRAACSLWGFRATLLTVDLLDHPCERDRLNDNAFGAVPTNVGQ